MSELNQVPAVVRGNERIRRMLEQCAVGGGAHALMFSGAPGHGSRAAAMWVAQSRLCPQGGGDGCEACERVARRTHPDLHWLVPEGLEQRIGTMRDLVNTLNRRPFEAALQVVVIEDAEMLNRRNPEASNSLLSMLEEPPGPVQFMLLVTRPQLLTPTLQSRSIEVAFPPLADDVVADDLRGRGVNPATLAAAGLTIDSVVRIARGDADRAGELAMLGPALERYRIAMQVAYGLGARQLAPSAAVAVMLQRVASVGAAATEAATAELERWTEQMSVEEARSFRSKSTANTEGLEQRVKRRVRRVETLEQRAIFADLRAWYRDLMALYSGADSIIACVDWRAQLESLRAAPAARRAVAALDALEETELRIEANNANKELALASLFAELDGLAADRVRARRTYSGGSRTPQGVDLALG